MTNLTVTGVWDYEASLDLQKDLNRALGLPFDDKKIRASLRRQNILIRCVILLIISFFLFAKWPVIVGLFHTVVTSFETGQYLKFGILVSVFVVISMAILLLAHPKFKSKPDKRDIETISFQDDGIKIAEYRRSDTIPWDIILQMKILNSGLAFEVKRPDVSGYFTIPNKFFTDKMLKEEIITFCHSKIKRI